MLNLTYITCFTPMVYNDVHAAVHMRKALKAVAVVVAICVVLIVASVVVNLYALSSLQFRPHGEISDDIDLFDLSTDVQMEACNPTFMPASFDKLDVDVMYRTTKLATFVMWGEPVPPKTSAVIDGRINLDVSGLIGMFLGAFASLSEEEEFDPNEVSLIGTLDAPILGIFPFSVSQQFAMDETTDVFGGISSGSWDCD